MDNLHPTEASDDGALLITISTLARRFARRLLPPDAAEDLAHDIVLECLAGARGAAGSIDISLLQGFVRTIVLLRYIEALHRRRHRLSTDRHYTRELADTPHVWMSPELMIEDDEGILLLGVSGAAVNWRVIAAHQRFRTERLEYELATKSRPGNPSSADDASKTKVAHR